MRPKATVTGLDEEMFTQRIFINEGNVAHAHKIISLPLRAM